MKKRIAVIILLCIMLYSYTFYFTASAENHSHATVVFTHDLHSHIEQYEYNGERVGGFSRIKTIIDETASSNANTIVVDAGDFSMGTLYHTKFTTEAFEYRLLSQMGYDAIALGNHEFDFNFSGLSKMINIGSSKVDSPSPIICSNINLDKSDLSDLNIKKSSLPDSINKYKIVEKGNVKYAVFALMGNDASDVTFDEKVVFDDFIKTAKALVNDIMNEHAPDYIICLSHSGTGDSVKDEDIKLAKKVPDIDVIVSAHTHSILEEPIIVGDTVIVSCGEYGEYVGELMISCEKSSNRVISYKLHKVTDSVKPDESIEKTIQNYKHSVSEYLSTYGFESSDQILAHSNFNFAPQNTFDDELNEQPLGNLISDSYKYAVKCVEGDKYENVDVAIVPLGVIRNSITKGDITVNDVFEICSLGIGADGTAGYPLCSVYVYGSELKQIAEIDSSVSSVMSYAQLYSSGMCYSINTNRMFMNRVYDCWLLNDNGNRVEIDDDKLYRVVSSITSAKMLGTVKDKSFGILEITPKDKNGSPITDFNQHILHDADGNEIKEWVAFAKYLESFEKIDGVSVIPNKYSAAEGRKLIYNNLDLSAIFKNWNFITWVVFVVINVLLVIIVYVAYRIIKSRVSAKNIE